MDILKHVKGILLIFLVFYICGAVEYVDDENLLPLINRLDNENPVIIRNAAFRLKKIGKPAVDSLLFALKNKNRTIRSEIPGILVSIQGTGSLIHLIEALHDNDRLAAAKAQVAIAMLGVDAVEHLIPYLEKRDDSTKLRILRVMGSMAIRISEMESGEFKQKWKLKLIRIVPSLLKLLQSGNPDIRANTLWVLKQIGDPGSLVPVLPLLNENDVRVRIEAIETSGILGVAPAFKPLIELLGDNNWRIRMEAAVALGRIKDKESVLPLIDGLEDKDWRVRHRVIVALGLLKDHRAIVPLVRLFKRENDSFIKKLVIYALGEIADAQAVDFLASVINHKDDKIKERTVYALEAIGKPSVETLIKALKKRDNSIRLRRLIIDALVSIGDRIAVEPLIDALKDKYPDIRRKAVTALGEFKDKRAFEPLLNALKDKNKWVRSAAAGVFGNVKDPRAVDAIKKISETDPDEYVRRDAESALKKIGKNRIEVSERFDDGKRKIENVYRVFWDTETLEKQKHYDQKFQLIKIVDLVNHIETRYTYFRKNSLKLRAGYKNSQFHGKVMEWDRRGIIRKEELWENGKLIKKIK